jgi:hypothetical protein
MGDRCKTAQSELSIFFKKKSCICQILDKYTNINTKFLKCWLHSMKIQ